ncbi:hypothetical protein KU48_15525 [Bacillus safensis]|nr:hypothetical protein KU48_15525 [Bacillus safensis]
MVSGELENYAIEVAQFFHQKQDFKRLSEYYMLALKQETKLKKGRLLMKLSRVIFAVAVLTSVRSVLFNF